MYGVASGQTQVKVLRSKTLSFLQVTQVKVLVFHFPGSGQATHLLTLLRYGVLVGQTHKKVVLSRVSPFSHLTH